MKLATIKFLILFLISMHAYAGVSVVGTCFFINDNKKTSVKIINDNESDYLIKSNIENVNDSSSFIISPPLLLVKKNQSNIVNLILNSNEKNSQDNVYDFVITAIPKSNISSGNNINLSVRSHFKLIRRYKEINDDIIKLLEINPNSQMERKLYNPTLSFLTLYVSCDINNQKQKRLNLYPNESSSIHKCKNDTWVSLVRDDGSISSMQKIQMRLEE